MGFLDGTVAEEFSVDGIDGITGACSRGRNTTLGTHPSVVCRSKCNGARGHAPGLRLNGF